MNLHKQRWVVGVGTILSIAGCATGSGGLSGKSGANYKAPASAEYSQRKLLSNLEVHHYRFTNGLKLMVAEDHSSPTFAYQTWFKVGSKDEVPGYTGLAHLFEHMMFKGTKKVTEGEFDRTLEGAGAEGMNAFTSQDYTAYIQELPKSQLEMIARLESDRMVNLVVNEASFSTEREVVQNERRLRTENNPEGLMRQELYELAYSQHPYRWPVIGYQADLERMSAEDARKFYIRHYAPNFATIVVTGDVDHRQVAGLVDHYYGKLQPQAAEKAPFPIEGVLSQPRRKNLKLNIQVEKLFIAYPIPASTDPDYPALALAQSVLAGGRSSRLEKALVNTGLATNIGAAAMDGEEPSLFLVAINMQSQKRAAHGELVALKEIERLANAPISKQELERAKNSIAFGYYEALDSSSKLATFLGEAETRTGDFRIVSAQVEKIKNLTSQDVTAVVKKYLDAQRRIVITGLPR